MGHLLAKVGLWERRRDKRISMRGWACRTYRGPEEQWVGIGDISQTGIYLITNDRWPLGTSIQIILQGRSHPSRDFQPSVRLPARCVRLGENGAGLAFTHQYGDRVAWSSLMTKAAALPGPNDAVRLFCATRALAFLHRVSPAGKGQILDFFSGALSFDRIDNAIAIALKAEELLASQNGTAKTKANLYPAAVLHILKEGSKAHEELVQHCWAGLLITCSRARPENNGWPDFANLLSALEQVQIRILAAAWSSATKTGWEPGFIFPKSFFCSAEEIRMITGKKDLVEIERYLNNLYQLGLLERTGKVNLIGQIERANLTPTALGLRFFARCIGQGRVPDTFSPSEPVSSGSTSPRCGGVEVA